MRIVILSILLMVCLTPSAQATAPPKIAGTFAAVVDFTSLQLKDGPGGTCVLTVNGTLVFPDPATGAVEQMNGEAAGTTTALIAAPCAAVATTPPGTFPDVFQFQGSFKGTIGTKSVTADLTYAGVTRVGGEINALITLRGKASGVLRTHAQVAVGGSYSGWVTV
jgi:hypothetical protein